MRRPVGVAYVDGASLWGCGNGSGPRDIDDVGEVGRWTGRAEQACEVDCDDVLTAAERHECLAAGAAGVQRSAAVQLECIVEERERIVRVGIDLHWEGPSTDSNSPERSPVNRGRKGVGEASDDVVADLLEVILHEMKHCAICRGIGVSRGNESAQVDQDSPCLGFAGEKLISSGETQGRK